MCDRFTLKHILSECTQLPQDIITHIARFIDKKPKKNIDTYEYRYVDKRNLRIRHKYLSEFFILG